MPDGLLPRPDTRKAALTALAEEGAHFVLCGTKGGPKAARVKGWPNKPASLQEVLQHRGLVGVVPASLGCVVVDVDQREGGRVDDMAAEVIERLGTPLAEVATKGKGGWHIWYKSRDAAKIANGPGWRNGDIRGCNGYAILWHPELVAEGLADTTRLPANLMGVDLNRLPPKPKDDGQPKGGEVGSRNITLHNETGKAAVNGLSIEPAAAAARQRGLLEPEIAATQASAVKWAERVGIRTPVADAWTPPGLAFCLEHLGVGLRLNVRAKRYEYRIEGAWLVADDERDSWLRGTIAENFSVKKGSTSQRLKYSPEMFLDLRRALGNDLRRDPFRDWLEALPPWDGEPRIDGLLGDMFGAEDGPLTRWASRYIGIGAVQRAFQPGAKIDEVPILLGPQGAGKSAFVRAWFSEAQHEWHGDAVDLSARPKEQAEQLAGRVVCELSELAGIRKAELERLKSFLTRQDDGQFRWAYARSPVPSPRVCIFVGTTNEAECLPNDPSGNRRFVVVDLKHGCNVQAASIDREQWWAEALARYRDGARANLPRDLHTVAAEQAETHRARDTMEEAVAEAAVDLDSEFTLGDLHDAVYGHGSKPPDKATQMRLSAALRNLGFRRVRGLRQGVRQWLWSRA